MRARELQGAHTHACIDERERERERAHARESEKKRERERARARDIKKERERRKKEREERKREKARKKERERKRERKKEKARARAQRDFVFLDTFFFVPTGHSVRDRHIPQLESETRIERQTHTPIRIRNTHRETDTYPN